MWQSNHLMQSQENKFIAIFFCYLQSALNKLSPAAVDYDTNSSRYISLSLHIFIYFKKSLSAFMNIVEVDVHRWLYI